MSKCVVRLQLRPPVPWEPWGPGGIAEGRETVSLAAGMWVGAIWHIQVHGAAAAAAPGAVGAMGAGRHSHS